MERGALGLEGEPMKAGRGSQIRGASSGTQIGRQTQTPAAPERGPRGASWVPGLRAGRGL